MRWKQQHTRCLKRPTMGSLRSKINSKQKKKKTLGDRRLDLEKTDQHLTKVGKGCDISNKTTKSFTPSGGEFPVNTMIAFSQVHERIAEIHCLSVANAEKLGIVRGPTWIGAWKAGDFGCCKPQKPSQLTAENSRKKAKMGMMRRRSRREDLRQSNTRPSTTLRNGIQDPYRFGHLVIHSTGYFSKPRPGIVDQRTTTQKSSVLTDSFQLRQFCSSSRTLHRVSELSLWRIASRICFP